MKLLILISALFLLINRSAAQASDPIPVQCAGVSEFEEPEELLAPNCSHTSTLWSSNARHLPHPDARSIHVRANFIILQKIDGTGNFQDIPEHRAFLDEWFDVCNERLGNLWGSSNCSPLIEDAKVQIVPNWIFLPDPNPTEWN
ncbi:MAG: hypothetical protein IPH04_15180 [Saprospirales bacterium]|nr:hypothetical protein [Saprospirales bacterium]